VAVTSGFVLWAAKVAPTVAAVSANAASTGAPMPTVVLRLSRWRSSSGSIRNDLAPSDWRHSVPVALVFFMLRPGERPRFLEEYDVRRIDDIGSSPR
jgi:hypothetical protein